MWLCVAMYLMCGPRQLIFQHGPDTKRWDNPAREGLPPRAWYVLDNRPSLSVEQAFSALALRDSQTCAVLWLVGHWAASLASTHQMSVTLPDNQGWQPRMSPDLAKRPPGGKIVPGWEQLQQRNKSGKTPSRPSGVFSPSTPSREGKAQRSETQSSYMERPPWSTRGILILVTM